VPQKIRVRIPVVFRPDGTYVAFRATGGGGKTERADARWITDLAEYGVPADSSYELPVVYVEADVVLSDPIPRPAAVAVEGTQSNP